MLVRCRVFYAKQFRSEAQKPPKQKLSKKKGDGFMKFITGRDKQPKA